MEVFQEGRKEQLFPVLLLVEVWSLDLHSEGVETFLHGNLSVDCQG